MRRVLGSILLAACRTPEPAVAEPPPERIEREPPPKKIDDDAELHGALEERDGQTLLRVWGTPAQMGYAHGFLLRDRIVDVVENYALAMVPPGTLDTAATFYSAVADIAPSLQAETEGIVAGMKAAGGARVESLGRELTAADLLVLNALTDLIAIGCSSVSTWDERGAVMVRNLDWTEDPDLLRNQVLIVWRPSDPERQPLVSVAFAGYVGCLSCMNEAGVAALFNMGYGDGAASVAQALGGFAPSNLLLRDALERRDVDGDGASTGNDVEHALREHTNAGSFIVHVLEPTSTARDRSPARVLEVEADGVHARGPDRDSPLGASMLAATNHLRGKEGPQQCSRYAKIEKRVTQADRELDHAALWSLGREVRLPQVVHTLLVEPDARVLSVWLRRPGEARGATRAATRWEWSALIGLP
jgi:hypothetical protein